MLVRRLISVILAFTLALSLCASAGAAEGNVKSIALGGRHGAAITSDGALYTWGGSDYGQVGDGRRSDTLSPSESLSLSEVASVSAGGGHTLALRADGTLWAWGDNIYGQVGDGTREARLDPVKILDSVTDISAGESFSLAVKTDGTLWAWGANYYGQVGDGTRKDQLSPVKIMDGVTKAAGGGRHGLAVKTDGTLWSWGCNENGQLGDGLRVTRLEPRQVLASVSGADAGGESSLAVKTDGTLWTWGDNTSGQLGDGTRTTRLEPVKIMDSVTAAASGGATQSSYTTVQTDTDSASPPPAVYIPFSTTEGHGLALKSDGTLWSWGYNAYGQLGDGSRTTRLAPAQVLSDVRELAAGSGASAAVKTDGTLWTWGHNVYGQVGDGTRQDKLSPVKILEDIKGAAASPEALPAWQKIFVNGRETPVEAYVIGEANYLKARDVAAALMNTNKRFSATFDAAAMTVVLTTGREYTLIGGELTPGGGPPKSTQPSTHGVSLDGRAVYPRGYAIDGANYYMLRDFMKLLDVYAAYDAATDSVIIDTSKGYAD
ncbi:MAG: hypothetical protein LBK23_05505 [Oscillospiraceae bacterium]|jgi:alpha-tubulin suppressor-like RCC1 family protein|nr:hypothetical protein [Oscillospiraceae bacterium]